MGFFRKLLSMGKQSAHKPVDVGTERSYMPAAGLKCSYCGQSLVGDKFKALADVRIMFGKTTLPCPECGRNVDAAAISQQDQSGNLATLYAGSSGQTARRTEPLEIGDMKEALELVEAIIADNLQVNRISIEADAPLESQFDDWDELDIIGITMRIHYDLGVDVADVLDEKLVTPQALAKHLLCKSATRQGKE